MLGWRGWRHFFFLSRILFCKRENTLQLPTPRRAAPHVFGESRSWGAASGQFQGAWALVIQATRAQGFHSSRGPQPAETESHGGVLGGGSFTDTARPSVPRAHFPQWSDHLVGRFSETVRRSVGNMDGSPGHGRWRAFLAFRGNMKTCGPSAQCQPGQSGGRQQAAMPDRGAPSTPHLRDLCCSSHR